MSLDVYLTVEGAQVTQETGIWVRKDGRTQQISWDEWYPDFRPVVARTARVGTDTVFSYNITHNLSTMADKAGLYTYLWRPEEFNVTKAWELIAPLESGLEILKSDPVRFRQYNPENGWGTYEGLVEFVEAYLAACREHPDAVISVSR